MYRKHEVLEPFFREPSRRFHLRELARILRWGPGRVERNVGDFIQKGVIIEKKEKILKLYRANKDSEEFKLLKLFYTLLKLRGLVEYLEKELRYPETIVLFGSARKGEDDERSDVDICVVGKEKKVELEKFKKELNRNISLLFLDRGKLDKLRKDNPELLSNIINGIVIRGYLKVSE